MSLFRREHLLALEDAMARIGARDLSGGSSLESVGDNFLGLAEGPVAVFRDLALAAYRSAARSCPGDGRLLFKVGAACLQRVYSDREQNVLDARSHLESALRLLSPADSVTRGLADNSLGLVYNEPPFSGDHRLAALSCFRRALLAFGGHGHRGERAMVLLNMGNAHGAEDPESAFACYREARQLYLDLHRDADAARAEQNIGLMLLDRTEGDRAENVEDALAAFRMSLSRINADREPYDYAVGLLGLGKALAHRIRGQSPQNFREALPVFQEAARIFLALGILPAARAALTGEGGLRYELSQWAEASAVFNRAIELLQSDWSEQGSAQSRLRLARDQARVIDFAVLAAKHAGDPEGALEIMERGRNRVLAASYGARDLPDTGALPARLWKEFRRFARERAVLEQELTLGRLQLPVPAAQTYATAVEQQLEACRLGQEQIVEKIRRKQPDFLPVAEPMRFEAIRAFAATLGSPVCALRPTSKGTLVFAFLADGRFRHEVIDAVTSESLRTVLLDEGRFVHAYEELQRIRPNGSARDVDAGRQEWIGSMEPMLRTLHETLIAPCLSILDLAASGHASEIRPKLYLMAGGVLDLVPLQATFEERNGKRRYLADVVDVAHFSSFRLLSRALEQTAHRRLDRLTALEGPDDDLPYAAWEVAAASALFGRSRFVVTREEAQIRGLLNGPAGESAFLVSCHAESHARDALRSGLFLKPRSTLPDYPLAELLGADLRGCPLVILSACETSLAEFHDPADECLNLANAFLAAGAAAVVGTQWEVNDIAAALWTARFLRQVCSGSVDPLRAACAASLWIRDSGAGEKRALLEAYPYRLPPEYVDDVEDQDFWHPYFWANHRFHGVSRGA